MPPLQALRPTPILSDGDVVLRALEEGDLPAVVEQSRDVETARWTSAPADYDLNAAVVFLERTRALVAEGGMEQWTIERAGAFAGLVSLRRTSGGVTEVSFAAHPAQRGRGAMTSAVRLVSRHAFEKGARVVLWHALLGNFGSRKVAWRAGFDIAADPIWRAAPPRRGGGPEQVWVGRLLPGEPMEPRHPWLEAPDLEADGIRIRAFRAADQARFAEDLDEAIAAYAANLPTRAGFPAWLLAQESRLAMGAAVPCAVVDAATDLLLGGVNLNRLDPPLFVGTGILGFWLLPDARGRGVLGRALEAFLPWALRPAADGGLGLERISAGCATQNRASARALRRAGFRLVGDERRSLRSSGDLEDALLFDLLATDDRDAQRVEPGHVVVIETARFRLRPWRDGDVPGADEGPDDASLRFMPSGAQPDAAAYPAWLARRRMRVDKDWGLDWCIADRESDHALGNLTIFDLGAPVGRFQAEIGYWLHPPARGQHVLAEAMPALLDHAFMPVADGGLGLTRLHAGTDLDNLASQSVLLRAGFRESGRERQSYRNGVGELTDGVTFELLAIDERRDNRPRSVPEVTLDGERLRLRPWRDADAGRVVEACVDSVTRHWLAGMPAPYTADTALAYIARCHQHARSGAALHFAIASLEGDACVGVISVMGLYSRPPADPTAGELGYWTHPDARGQGVMGEAVRLVVAHAFASSDEGGLGLRRLVVQAANGNAASLSVARSAGFHEVGVARLAERLGDGSFVDLVTLDLLNANWQPPDDVQR